MPRFEWEETECGGRSTVRIGKRKAVLGLLTLPRKSNVWYLEITFDPRLYCTTMEFDIEVKWSTRRCPDREIAKKIAESILEKEWPDHNNKEVNK